MSRACGFICLIIMTLYFVSKAHCPFSHMLATFTFACETDLILCGRLSYN